MQTLEIRAVEITNRLNSIFFYSLPFVGMIGGKMEAGESNIGLYIAFLAAWGMLAIRLVKTNIDSCIVDALTLEKAKIDASDKKFLGDFLTGASVIRNKRGLHWWLIDFVLVRQVGFVSLAIIATIGELAFEGAQIYVGRLELSPLMLLAILYAVLSTTAVVYGIIEFSQREIVERNYFALRAELDRKYAPVEKEI